MFKHPWKCAAFPLFAILALTAGGCINGVSWLPDSSGFVFTTDSGRLVLFDVASKKSKVFVADTKSNTFFPALSADGKRIATAGLSFEGNKGTLRIVVYNLDGKIEHESPPFPWGVVKKGAPERNDQMTQLFWQPEGAKILVYGSTHQSHGTTGIYDLKKRTMVSWERTLPTIHGATPIRPDGKGFLLTHVSKDGEVVERIAFVDWTGSAKKLDLRFDVNADNLTSQATWASLRWSFWKDHVATSISTAGVLHLDTAKGFGTLTKAAPDLLAHGDEVIWMKTELASGMRVLVLTPRNKGNYHQFRAVSFDPKTKKEKELVPAGKDRLLGLFPSPDRKHVIFRVWEGDRRGPDADRIFLIDNRGELGHTIEVFEEFRHK